MKTPNNYYEATRNLEVQCTQLAGTVRADICIVGAGLTGLGTAIELAEKGYEVVVLEAEKVAFGASGRSGGQIASGYSNGMIETAEVLGLEDAKELWRFSELAKQILHHRRKRFQINCDYSEGEIYAALRPSHMKWLHEEKEFIEQHYGYDGYEMLDKEDLKGHVTSDRYLGALLDHEGGHIHPLNYTLGLAKAAQLLGVQIFEGSKVLSYEEKGKIDVKCQSGSVISDKLILAGNAYLKNVSSFLEKRMLSARSTVLATEPLEEDRLKALYSSSACVCDTNYDLDYYKRTPDNRLVYGGQDLSLGNLIGGKVPVQHNMLKTFPGLADVKIDYVWEGNLSVNKQRLPDLGRISDNVYYAQGYSGQGIPLSAVASVILAEAVDGEMAKLDVFGRIRHSYIPPYKILQVPLYTTVLLWNKIRDLL